MYHFYVTLHARPEGLTTGGHVTVAGRDYPTLAVDVASLAGGFAVTFEVAAAALAALPRMYVEPDGSFVWVSSHAAPPWQVDGVLYDRDERLLFVDLKGTCPPADFAALLSCFGWPETPVIFQLTREAVFLAEQVFRDLAAIA